MSHEMYFDSFCWANRPISDEKRGLQITGFLYTKLELYKDPELWILEESADHHGHKEMAKRMIDLLLKDEYSQLGLFGAHLELFKVFTRVRKIRQSIVAQKGHIATIQKAWGRLRTPIVTPPSAIQLSPRACLQAMLWYVIVSCLPIGRS